MTSGKISVIAHRGGGEWAPENTMQAFSNCLELGLDGIELDVRRCATGELVVIHDADLARTTNGAGLVCEASLDELKRLSAGLWFDKEFYREKIPLLQEVLDLVAGQCVINVEVKNAPIAAAGVEEDLLAVLEGYVAPEKIIISSFDHYVLLELSKLLQDSPIKLGLLADASLIDSPAYAARLNAAYFNPCFGSLRQDMVDQAHKAGLAVHTWTLNKPSQWAAALKMGVDGVVTADPEGLMIAWGRALPAGAASPLQAQ